ncbi:MAG: TonB family protein [Mucilaginibacter sp.]|uniref:TonB family protein n=1 Tax=Mucilaginibacter sp. TaxID=1882438 RepID=UPI00326408F4
MFVKYLLSATFLASFTLSSFAQTTTTYYTNKGKQVSTADESDYSRVSSRADTTSASLYNIIEYYKNGKIKRKGTSTHAIYNVWHGPYADFYPSGNKQTEGTYTGDKLIGNYYEYYPNGVLHSVKDYFDPSQLPNKNAVGSSADDYLIKTCNDSTGKAMLINGNGHYIAYHPGFKKVYEQGDVQNGKRNGQWTGGNNYKDSIKFTETYEKGMLIKGESRDKYGKVYNYTIREASPEYEGGEQAFARFLSTNVTYPAKSKKNNVVGRVILQFVIERDGSLTGIKVVKTPNSELGNEGVRVLKLSPKWKPGIQYGRPVRVQFTVPLNFDLQD